MKWERSGIALWVCKVLYWSCIGKKDVWDSARSAFGMSVVVPLLGRGMLDVGYIFNQKRFTFSFILNK